MSEAQEGLGRGLGVPVASGGGAGRGSRKSAAPLHLCYCCHCRCHLGTPGSPGRSPAGHGPGTPRRHLELGCVGLSPRLPLSLGAGAGPLLEKWQVRSTSVCLTIFERPSPPTLPPLLQPALSPPTIRQELTAARGHTAGQTASPGTGEIGIFLAVPAKARKRNHVLPWDSDRRLMEPGGGRQSQGRHQPCPSATSSACSVATM